MARAGERSGGAVEREDADGAGRVRSSTGPYDKSRNAVSSSPVEDGVEAIRRPIPASLYSRQQPAQGGEAMEGPFSDSSFFSAVAVQQEDSFGASCPAQQDPETAELRQPWPCLTSSPAWEQKCKSRAGTGCARMSATTRTTAIVRSPAVKEILLAETAFMREL